MPEPSWLQNRISFAMNFGLRSIVLVCASMSLNSAAVSPAWQQAPFRAEVNLVNMSAIVRSGFGNHLRLVSEATPKGSAIASGLEAFAKGDHDFPQIGPKEEREGGTALYDAIYFSIAEKLQKAGERRRALLVFSDGEDNSSEHDLLDVLEEAQDTGTLVYCIRYTQKEHGRLTARNKYGMRVMRHIATLTGAADFDAPATDLPAVFAQIGNELRSMYQIGYVSTNGQPHDGSFRKVTVLCKRPRAVVRAKSGYYAQ